MKSNTLPMPLHDAWRLHTKGHDKGSGEAAILLRLSLMPGNYLYRKMFLGSKEMGKQERINRAPNMILTRSTGAARTQDSPQ